MKNLLDFFFLLWGLACFLCLLFAPLILVGMVALLIFK